ncbi:MAG TPA: kelch repeat-containing protein [Haliangiales bacterium]|nr:kelch repeat-containing protein [Haliangiales bacterium]
MTCANWAAALLLAAACSPAVPVLAPIVDVPDASSPAYPFTDIDELRLSIAHAGQDADIALVSVAPGDTPELASVPFGDDLVVHLSGRRAGVEVAYGRTCAVSVNRDTNVASVHLYFARIVKWAAGPQPSEPRAVGRDAYATPAGDGVFVGGAADGDLTDMERFDARAGAFVALPGRVAARRGAALAPLRDGRALRIGGVAGPPGADVAVASCELLSPTAAAELQVQTIADDCLHLVDAAAATLVDGGVVVAGGRRDQGAGFQPSGATWLFRLGDAGIPAPPRLLPTAALAHPRYGHTATRLGDEVGAAVLIVGGRDAVGPVAAAELYEPLRESYAAFAPQLLTPRYDHRAVLLPDGSILIVGGRDSANRPTASLEVYLPRIGQFAAVGTLPAGAGLVGFTATALPDGRVLLAGGRDAGNQPVATAYILRLDPIDGTVDISPTDGLAVPRAGHSAVPLCDGTVLIVGGTVAPGAPGSERYNPPSAGRR